MIGELFGELARSLFSTVGSFLVGFALLGLILIGRATFSFIALMRWIGRLGSVVGREDRGGARSVAGAWAKARELEREKEAQRSRTRRRSSRGPPSGDGDDPRAGAIRAGRRADSRQRSRRAVRASSAASGAARPRS